MSLVEGSTSAGCARSTVTAPGVRLRADEPARRHRRRRLRHDGTLLHANDPSGPRGAHPIAGAIETVERVRASGRRVLFFTNGTGRPPVQYAADIRALGFTIADEEFMNPAVVAARWIARRHPGKSVLVLGGPGVVAPLRDLGVETIAPVSRAVAESCWSAGTTRSPTPRCAPPASRSGRARRCSPHPRRASSRSTAGRTRLVGRGRRGHPPDDRRARPHARQAVARRAARGLPHARSRAGADPRRGRRPRAWYRDGPPRRPRAALVLTGVGTEAAEARPPARRPDAVLPDVTALQV